MLVERMRQAVAWVLAVLLLSAGSAVPILGPGYWLAVGVRDRIDGLARRWKSGPPRRTG